MDNHCQPELVEGSENNLQQALADNKIQTDTLLNIVFLHLPPCEKL